MEHEHELIPMENKSLMKVVLKRTRIRNQRSIIVVIGPEGFNQVPTLYKILAKGKLDVLWCSNDCEDIRKIGWHTNEDCNVTHCLYSDIKKVHPMKFNFVVIKDMEAYIKPGDLANIVQSIRGSGTLVFLFSKIKEIKKFTSPKLSDSKSRFMKRLCATFKSCTCCVILNDKLDLLIYPKDGPELFKIKDKQSEVQDLKMDDQTAMDLQHSNEALSYDLKQMEEEYCRENDVAYESIARLTEECLTLDQTKFFQQCSDVLKKRAIYSVVSASSPSGRGKSAVLGLAIAGAIAMRYSNIFVSSLSFDNVVIVFKFLLSGLTSLQYKEDVHYDIIESANPKSKIPILGLNIFKDHPQAVRFIYPGDIQTKLEQAELVVIDEAAAIPLPLLRKLIGPYVVLMASTTEGCGASGKFLYESMVEEIRCPSSCLSSNPSLASLFPTSKKSSVIRIDLNEPLYHAAGDLTERWINHTLCLESCIMSNLSHGIPAPEHCRLFYVCRETLFSYESHAEKFLQQLMSLFMCSKRKISPDYLLEIADGEDYHIFCLLPPFDASSTGSYEILSAILVHNVEQVPLNLVYSGTNNPDFFEQFKRKSLPKGSEEEYIQMQGICVIDIVTHPAYRKMGYGYRAVQLLQEFYNGKCVPLDDNPFLYSCKNETNSDSTKTNPPLLLQLTEVEPQKVEYILVLYYLTQKILRFWKRSGYVPLFINSEKNDAEEHMCLAMKGFDGEEVFEYMKENWICFREYYFHALRFDLKYYSSLLALNVLNCKFNRQLPKEALTKEEIDILLHPRRMKALEKYSNNLNDLHCVMPCLRTLAQLYFRNRFIDVDMTTVQQAIFLSYGLQNKPLDLIVKDLDLTVSQIIANLNRVIRRLTKHLTDILEKTVEKDIPVRDINMVPVTQTLDDELGEAAQKIMEKQTEDLKKLKDMDFSEFAIKGSEDDWEKALHGGRKTLVSIKSLRKDPENVEFPSSTEKKDNKFKKNPKRKR